VREEQVLSLEEAVKKMTSVTAERFGLTDLGVIREGAWSDLVLFDAQTVASAPPSIRSMCPLSMVITREDLDWALERIEEVLMIP
jgi:N-acyl-D-amino-acid deacylase